MTLPVSPLGLETYRWIQVKHVSTERLAHWLWWEKAFKEVAFERWTFHKSSNAMILLWSCGQVQQGWEGRFFFRWLYFCVLRNGNVFNQSQAKVGIHRSFDQRWLFKGNQRADVNILVVHSITRFNRVSTEGRLLVFLVQADLPSCSFFFPNSDFHYQKKAPEAISQAKSIKIIKRGILTIVLSLCIIPQAFLKPNTSSWNWATFT